MSTQEHDAAMAAGMAPVVEDASAPTEPQSATFANAPTARAADGDPEQPDVPSSVESFVSSTGGECALLPAHPFAPRAFSLCSVVSSTTNASNGRHGDGVHARDPTPLVLWNARGCHLVLFQVPPELAGEHQLAVQALELWRLYGAVFEESVRKLVNANAFTTCGGNYESPKDVEAAVLLTHLQHSHLVRSSLTFALSINCSSASPKMIQYAALATAALHAITHPFACTTAAVGILVAAMAIQTHSLALSILADLAAAAVAVVVALKAIFRKTAPCTELAVVTDTVGMIPAFKCIVLCRVTNACQLWKTRTHPAPATLAVAVFITIMEVANLW
eukprot:CAMPEP_0115869364 /NCGR_PEP_ID=MMETSP0287-20121206/21773_1 /TAXON_ID=412157 /ORGANISM="Chrysochromulina rotalis, Strain UIO044" /LENGTH=332 /DNA_ID=CAMNT_0003324053 /DNA_START=44 /DNA_END=1041 /DNA_ORIENTATION=-